MGKDAKKDTPSPITDKSKLLPGKGKFSADDSPKEEGEDEGEGEDDGGSKVDDIIKFLNGEVKQQLDEINTSVVEIKDVLVTQNQLADDRDEDMRQALLDSRKSKREGKLEGDGKEKGLKEKLLGQVTKPVEVLFEGANEDIYKPLDKDEIDSEFFDWFNDEVPEKFAFLFLGQWTKGGYC